MGNSLIVRRSTEAARSEKASRAAQYVRMSTDYQRYSIENQAVAIAAYAQLRGLSIVRTYRDDGESGLTLKNRAGLLKLLSDVSSHQVDFEHILVYDVSRWGRFQDVDEAAHYEFICKQAGIRVAYCAEQFENDGSLVSSIVKNLKRVMAAEHSRELSVKVHTGACRFARMGFQLGGRVTYALQRVLVDERLQPKGILKHGDRKYLQTDHVRLQPGPANEVAIVKWIFGCFLEAKSEIAIARQLNQQAIPSSTGKRWTAHLITRILKNENYVGNMVYNRRSKKLGAKLTRNPKSIWVRGEGCIDPIIEIDVFLAARKIIDERRVDLTEEEMLARLRRTLVKKGRLSPRIINDTVGLPCHHVYIAHFGSIRNAYRLIGYSSERNCDYIDARPAWAEALAELASRVSDSIEKIDGRKVFEGATSDLQVNGTHIAFRIARWTPGEKHHYAPRWYFQRRALTGGWIVAIRLGDGNSAILDYLLMPAICTDRKVIRFSDNDSAKLGISSFETSDALVRSVSRRITPKPVRLKRSRPARLSAPPR